MNREEFETEILTGDKNDYVSTEALEFFSNTANFNVINRSALEKDSIPQTEFISIALPRSGVSFSDDELITQVRTMLLDNSRDIQKHQFRYRGYAPESIEIWRHGNGFSAFAL